MRNAIVGVIIGIVAGIVLGTTLIAPRLKRTDVALPEPAQTLEAQKPPAVTAEKKPKPVTKPVKRLRMASAFPLDLPLHGTAAKRLERTVWRLSDGTLELKLHPPGALVAKGEAVDAVVSGAIDALFTSTDSLASREPAIALFAGMPLGASVEAYLGWMSDGGGRALLESILTDMGLQGVLCGMVPNSAGGWFRKPVVTAEDLKGQKIRTDPLTATLFRRLGADALTLDYADTAIALESGYLFGAQLSSPHVDVALGLAMKDAVYYVPGWRTPAASMLLLMPLERWEGLGALQQTRLRSACAENVLSAISGSEALQFNALKTIVEQGADVRPWPTEITDAMQGAWKAEAKAERTKSQIYDRVLKSYARFQKGQSIWEELARPRP